MVKNAPELVGFEEPEVSRIPKFQGFRGFKGTIINVSVYSNIFMSGRGPRRTVACRSSSAAEDFKERSSAGFGIVVRTVDYQVRGNQLGL